MEGLRRRTIWPGMIEGLKFGYRMRIAMLLFALTISLSAFLLFEVQPIIAKIILPWFGGSSAVWSTCMLFFQMVLLLGYCYAHWLHTRVAPRKQALIHAAMLAVSAATLPILPNPAWKSAGLAHPSFTILALLAVTVGLPYFALSSTSPLLQAWYARSHAGGLPYRLFALSNFASLLALITYPFLVEPNLPTRLQGTVWSAAYAGFAVLCGVTGWRASLRKTAHEGATGSPVALANDRPRSSDRLLWLGLAASASVLLLAVTNHLTQDVAAIPFLWILPLTVYLLSFILCFESPRFYQRWIFLPLLPVSLGYMTVGLLPWSMVQAHWLHFITHLSIRTSIAAFGAALLVCCMVCHGELARLKPHPRYLTGFYVTVSMGGACGGLFVGLVAPNLFRAYYEFPIGLGVCAALVFMVFAREWRHLLRSQWLWAMGGSAVALAGYLVLLGVVLYKTVDGYRLVERNFYGQLRVEDDGDPRTDDQAYRQLYHGVINHGEQMLNARLRRLPITYFCPESGVGRAMGLSDGPRRIGVVGLGCGTLAAYGKAGDVMRIYEINPQVLDIARTQFTYLSDSPAKVETALGDGRLVLDSEPDQQFDILVIDAFSGDSIPVHLLTREAFALYFRHLKPSGILAVHVSNSYLDLTPVMERAASAFGKVAMLYELLPKDNDPYCYVCDWSLIMEPSTAKAHPELQEGSKLLRAQRPFRIWSDDFSNMFSILK